MPIKKRQSKRQTLHQKHKIRKKVRDHNRKLRREARRNPGKSKLKKDPGIPKLCPFKDALLHRVEQAKERSVTHQREVEKNRRSRMIAERRGLSSVSSMSQLANEASLASQEFEAKSSSRQAAADAPRESNAFVDTSRKAYYREFKKVVEASDVILEVLDARDPLGYRCEEIEQLILKKKGNKRIILVLNKIDLIPRANMVEWLKYLRSSFPTIAFKCSTQSQKHNLSQNQSVNVVRSAKGADAAGASTEHSLFTGSDCLGASALLALLKNYARSADIKTAITVGIIGYPNTGKSSLINSLKRQRAVGVGAVAGFTKKLQVIHLDKHIKLLDCPGIVFSAEDAHNADIMLRNCIRVEQIDDPIAPVEILLKRCQRKQLLVLYKIPHFDDTQQFLAHIAKKRGRIKRGGVPDILAAARTVLHDWNSGKISYYTMPPQQTGIHLSAKIISSESSIMEEGDDALMQALPDEDIKRVAKFVQVSSAQAVPDGELLNTAMGTAAVSMGDDETQHKPKDRGTVVIEASKSITSSLTGNNELLQEANEGKQDHAEKDYASNKNPALEMADERGVQLNAQRNKQLKKARKKAAKLRRNRQQQTPHGDAFDWKTDFIADNDVSSSSEGDQMDDIDDDQLLLI